MTARTKTWLLPLGITAPGGNGEAHVRVALSELTTDDDLAILRALAADCRAVVEIGTFTGSSAEALLSGMPDDGRLTCIDVLHPPAGDYSGSIPTWVRDRVRDMRLQRFAGRYDVLLMESVRAAALFPDGIFDLVFIDGSHCYAAVAADIDAWRPKVRSGGVLAGHDLDKPLLQASTKLLQKHKDEDSHKGLHYGVALALRERFGHVGTSKSADSTVWFVPVPE